MTVVDSAVWVAYFNGADSPHAIRLDALLADEHDIAILPLIIAEVLQGFRTESGFARARSVLLELPVVPASVRTHVAAAQLFRRLRGKGVSVRGTIDCIIAQVCIEHDAELLSPDADFAGIAQHTGLRLCAV